MPALSKGLTLWSAKHRSTRSKSSISSLGSFRSPTSPCNVRDGFGIPSPDDPDPFGVRALELAGFSIKEAGSKSRPSSDAFSYKPSPASPIFRLSTQSIDSTALRDPKRDSKRSCLSVDHGTQTANLPSPPPLDEMHDLCNSPPPIEEEPPQPKSPRAEKHTEYPAMSPVSTSLSSPSEDLVDDEIFLSDTESVHDVVVEQVVPSFQILNSPIASKPKIVNITKRNAPPTLPLKSPLRARMAQIVSPTIDTSLATSLDKSNSTKRSSRDDASSTYSSPSSPSIKSTFDYDRTSTETSYSPNPWTADSTMDDSDSLKQLQLYLSKSERSNAEEQSNSNSWDADLPPLSDSDGGESFAESDITHHDNPTSQDNGSDALRLAPYGIGEFSNTSGETLAVSVRTGDGLHNHKRSIDSGKGGSERSLAHLVKETVSAPDSVNVSDDGASVSSFYDEDDDAFGEETLEKGQTFHEAKMFPLKETTQLQREDAALSTAIA